MKCLECYADMPDSATSCPRCGTPPSIHRGATSTAFSYLPTGTPPWPTTMPVGTATAVKQTTDSVASAKAGSIADAKPRRSGGSIVTAILLVVLSVVIGVGATLAVLAATGSLASSSAGSTKVVHLPTPIPTSAATAGTGTPVATATT